MKKLSFKALGASLLAFGLTFMGVVAPAHATGVLNVSVTSGNTTIGTTGTNGAPISVSFLTATAGADNFTIEVPSAWTAANIGTLCAGLIINIQNGNSPTSCAAAVQGSALVVTITKSTTAWANSLGITVEFPTGSLNVATGRVFSVRSYTSSTPVDVGTGTLSSGNSVSTFTVSNATLVDASSNAISTLPASTAVPAFTATASGYSGGATVQSAGVMFSTNGYTEYFSVANAVNSMGSPPPSPLSWSPGSATCGVTAVLIGGVAQTGSSGVTCQKQTWTFGSTTAYAVRVYFSSATSSAISISIADNVFTSGSAGTFNFRLALSGSNTNGSLNIPVTVGGSVAPSSTPSSNSTSAALTINASTGSTIAGSTVAIQASGLQTTAAYTVTVQSTPQVIGSGNAVGGAVNSSVTIPAGLEAGWHTLTFTSTAADGSAVSSKVYFEVSATGTLLSSTTTIPAALANTGLDAGSLLAAGVLLALAGAVLMLVRYRRRNS